MIFSTKELTWIRAPKNYTITEDKIEIITEPVTDLWQRTYYNFQNDNAPCLQMKTSETYFSFTVKTAFESSWRFDQCGVVMYLNSDNWFKASIEFENDEFQRLGSVLFPTQSPITTPYLSPVDPNPVSFLFVSDNSETTFNSILGASLIAS